MYKEFPNTPRIYEKNKPTFLNKNVIIEVPKKKKTIIFVVVPGQIISNY